MHLAVNSRRFGKKGEVRRIERERLQKDAEGFLDLFFIHEKTAIGVAEFSKDIRHLLFGGLGPYKRRQRIAIDIRRHNGLKRVVGTSDRRDVIEASLKPFA